MPIDQNDRTKCTSKDNGSALPPKLQIHIDMRRNRFKLLSNPLLCVLEERHIGNSDQNLLSLQEETGRRAKSADLSPSGGARELQCNEAVQATLDMHALPVRRFCSVHSIFSQ